MNYPIFVIDENDLDIFANIESVSSYIEIYDVAENKAFDSSGNELRLKIKKHGRGLPYVAVEKPQKTVCQPEFLAMRIKRYLQTLDENLDTSQCELSELVALAVEMIGYS